MAIAKGSFHFGQSRPGMLKIGSSLSRLRSWLRPRSRWNEVSRLPRVLGWVGAVKYLIEGKRDKPNSVFRVHPRWSMHPLFGRRYSSDLDVFDQIFIQREYECLDDLREVGLVIDCGANVGYSSAYFLSHHPKSRIIAVEPDPENFAMLRRNLAPYGTRVTLIHAGVWSHTTRLALSECRYRDGLEWSRQVRVFEPGDMEAIEGVDIGTLLKFSGQNRISLLKVDVEGVEKVIFSANYQSWLGRVDAIAIELHDDSTFGDATGAFFTAIEGRGFNVSHSGELTICRKTNGTSRSRHARG